MAAELTGTGSAPRRTPVNLTKDNIEEFMQQIDAVVCDCDGVIWITTEDIPNSREALKVLRASGKRLFFVTNNSVSPAWERLNRIDFPVQKDEVVYPALAIARRLQQIGFKKKAFVMGVEKFKDRFRDVGIRVVPEKRTGGLLEENVPAVIDAMYTDPEVGAVVVDMDMNMNFLDFTNAANFVRKPGCLFLAGATEAFVPVTEESVYVGPGPFVLALESLSHRKAEFFGKPTPVMINEFLKDLHKLDLKRTVLIGDSLLQDMGVANACGMKKLLVLSGVSQPEDLDTCDSELIPDYVIKSLGEFIHLLS